MKFPGFDFAKAGNSINQAGYYNNTLHGIGTTLRWLFQYIESIDYIYCIHTGGKTSKCDVIPIIRNINFYYFCFHYLMRCVASENSPDSSEIVEGTLMILMLLCLVMWLRLPPCEKSVQILNYKCGTSEKVKCFVHSYLFVESNFAAHMTLWVHVDVGLVHHRRQVLVRGRLQADIREAIPVK